MWSFIQRPNITINSFGCYTQVFFIMTTCLKRSQKLPPSGCYTQVWLYNFIWSCTSLLKTCITMTNNKGFKAAPWWTSAFTEKEPDDSPSTEIAVLQIWYGVIIPFTKYSETLFCLKVKQIISLCALPKAFSRSRDKKQLLLVGSKFFCMFSQSKCSISSSFP